MIAKLAPPIAAMLLASTAINAQAEAATRILVLSDAYPAPIAEAVGAQIGEQMRKMAPGDRLLALDGPSLNRIADVSIPDEDIYARHPGHKMKLLRPAFEKVAQHLQASVAAEAKRDPATPPMQVNAPEVLDWLRYEAAGAPDVVLIGSARHHDPRQPESSMAQAYPNAALIAQGRAASPYGVAGAEGSLANVRVHFCNTDAGWVRPAQAVMVENAWTSIVAGLGGQLATFSPELEGCLGRFAVGATDGARKAPPPASTAAEPMMVDVGSAVVLPPVVPAEQMALLEELAVDPGQREALNAALGAGEVTLARLWLSDFDAEDGDAVLVTGGGLRIPVELKNAETEVVVPIVEGALQVTGLRDGNGGITVRIRVADASETVLSPVMAVGQSIQVPVLVQPPSRP